MQKRNWHASLHFLIAAAIIIFAASAILYPITILAQDNSSSKIYKKAIKEKNVILRLKKLNEVINQDPTHALALYEIGLIYKAQQNYRLAQNYFVLARNSFTDEMKDENKIAILYDLANTYEHNGKYQLYEKALNELQLLQISNNFRSRINFELGRLYYKQSRYEKALVILEDAKDLNKKDQVIYSNLIDIIKATQTLELKYAQAEQERLTGNYQKSLALFTEINQTTPDFKNVSTKIRAVKAAIRRAEKSAHNRLPELDTTKTTAETGISEAEPADRTQEKSKTPPKRPIANNPPGTTLENLVQNKDALIKTPNSERDSNTESKIEEINKINTTILSESFQIEVDSLFRRGKIAFENKNWLDATIDFEVLQNLNRNYKGADSLLTQARAELHKQNTAKIPKISRNHSVSYFFIGLTTIFLVPLFGFVFLPEVRAHYYLIRKDFYAASRIYEKIIARNPTKMKVYPKLAQIYLLSGRVDKTAIHVYKRALHLSIDTNQRDEIASLVMQKSLQEGHSDNDAIEVLEKVLKHEVVKK
ncbi:MAG: tetratricopeptide repeat protein [Calditrichaeota bacterium]|nr:MAG: tetratricopeptide repeat protein [Calditrichota bacterium]